jgi:hypothetical protein
VLRVRESLSPAAPPVLAFKRGGPAADGRFEAEELEEPLDPEAWRRVLQGVTSLADVDSRVVRRAAALAPAPALERLGWVRVRRSAFVLPGGTRIELDESEFEDGSRDWELELEAEDLERHVPALEEAVRRRRLPWRPQTMTKYQRFLVRLDRHPGRASSAGVTEESRVS